MIINIITITMKLLIMIIIFVIYDLVKGYLGLECALYSTGKVEPVLSDCVTNLS